MPPPPLPTTSLISDLFGGELLSAVTCSNYARLEMLCRADGKGVDFHLALRLYEVSMLDLKDDRLQVRLTRHEQLRLHVEYDETMQMGTSAIDIFAAWKPGDVLGARPPASATRPLGYNLRSRTPDGLPVFLVRQHRSATAIAKWVRRWLALEHYGKDSELVLCRDKVSQEDCGQAAEARAILCRSTALCDAPRHSACLSIRPQRVGRR